MLKLIVDCLGFPDESTLTFSVSDKARRFLSRLEPSSPRPLSTWFPTAQPLQVDLLSRMLTIDPAGRISVSDALDHPLFRDIRDPDSELDAGFTYAFGYDDLPLDELQLRDLIRDEADALRGVGQCGDSPQRSSTTASTPLTSDPVADM